MKQRARSNEDKQVRIDEILEAAKMLFSRSGYQGTTIEMITDEAGLSPAAFYRYFKSKLEIYRTLNSIAIDILQKLISDSLRKPGMTPPEKLQSITGAYFSFFKENRELYEITAVLHLGQREFFADLDMVPLLEQRAVDVLSIIKGIIDEGISGGYFRKLNSWNSAVSLWGMIDGILLLEIKGSTGFAKIKIESLIKQMFDIVLNGLTEK